jgi:hypothetical protein
LTSAVSDAQSGEPEVNDPSVLAVLDAKKGTFDSASGKVTLQKVGPRAVWFTDRPARQTGSYTVPQLLSVFFEGQPAPNAALEFEGNDESSDVAVVQASDPKYDAKKNQLTFTAKVIGDPTTDLRSDTALVDFVRRHDGKIAKSFGATRIFIDSAQPDGARDDSGTGAGGTANPVEFSGTVNAGQTKETTVDCTQATDGGYVARSPGDPQSVFDSPRIEGKASSEVSVSSTATNVVTWGHLFSRLATAVHFSVYGPSGDRAASGDYDYKIYCTSDQNSAWIIASVVP